MTTDVSPVCATEAERGRAEWLVNEITLAIVWSHIGRPGQGR
jgi:hypothetical protein